MLLFENATSAKLGGVGTGCSVLSLNWLQSEVSDLLIDFLGNVCVRSVF